MNYEYKTKPYEHQVKTLEQSCDKPAHALFLEMGLGKSKILIDSPTFRFQILLAVSVALGLSLALVIS